MLRIELTCFPEIIFMGCRICDEKWGYSRYPIQSYELVFVYHGNIEMTIDSNKFTVEEGDSILLHPGDIFSMRVNGTAKYYTVHFSLGGSTRLVSEAEARREQEKSVHSFGSLAMEDSSDLSRKKFLFLADRIQMGVYQEKIFSLLEASITDMNQMNLHQELFSSINLCTILVYLSRIVTEQLGVINHQHNGMPVPRIVQEATFYIHSNYLKRIRTEELSDLLGISPQYLIRVFKKHLGITPIQYTNRFRVARAKELLRYTSMYVKEVSQQAGFENVFYFCRQFKALEHMTPTEYRKKEIILCLKQ